MNYEIQINPKIVALAAAGAATLGMTLNEALMRPVVKLAAGQGSEKPAAKKGGAA